MFDLPKSIVDASKKKGPGASAENPLASFVKAYDTNFKPNPTLEKFREVLEEYEDVIENVDFRLDVERVKHDISRRTKYFLKKGK